MDLVRDFLGDLIAIFIAYTVNFIGCDLIYNSFNLHQTIKGGYWFILGPVLYWFPTLFKGLKKLIIYDLKQVKAKIIAWWNGDDGGSGITWWWGLGFNILDWIMNKITSDEYLQNVHDNMTYLKNTRPTSNM